MSTRASRTMVPPAVADTFSTRWFQVRTWKILTAVVAADPLRVKTVQLASLLRVLLPFNRMNAGFSADLRW